MALNCSKLKSNVVCYFFIILLVKHATLIRLFLTLKKLKYCKFQKQCNNTWLLMWINDLILVSDILQKYERKIIVVIILIKCFNLCKKKRK